jgi:tetratricopeptide (TPR) repeat protein
MQHLPTSDRALSLDEAMSIALVLQRTGQWSAAEEMYRSILAVAPDNADAVHFSGVLAHQQARGEQAVALIERSLELEPGRADWHSNLGIVLQDRLQLDEAIAAYERAIALEPEARRSRPRRRIELPFASIPSTRTPTTTSASC